MVEKITKLKAINPWGLSGGLFGSVTVILVLASAYASKGIDLFEVLVVCTLIAFFGFSFSLFQKSANEADNLLRETFDVMYHYGELIIFMQKRANSHIEVIKELENKNELQARLIEMLKSKERA